MTEPDVHRYLPQSPLGDAWGVSLRAGGRTHIPAHADYPPPGHPRSHDFRWPAGRTLREYQLVYLARGEGELATAAIPAQSVHAGQAFLLLPGEWHAYRPRRAVGWDEWWLAFTGPVPDRLRAQGLLDPSQPIFDGQGESLLFTAFHGAVAAIERQPPGWEGLAASGVLTALALLTSIGSGDPVMTQAAIVLQDASDRPVDLAALARDSGLSPAQFRRRFAAVHGVPPRTYHLRLRLDRARTLLSDPHRTLAQVADLLGFSSAFHLSRMYRQYHGQSPRG